MTPYEIMLSESQERMLLVAEDGASRKFSMSSRNGIDAVVVGEVTEATFAREDAASWRRRFRPIHWPKRGRYISGRLRSRRRAKKQRRTGSVLSRAHKPNRQFCKAAGIASHWSKRWITEQYDTSVRTNTLADLRERCSRDSHQGSGNRKSERALA